MEPDVVVGREQAMKFAEENNIPPKYMAQALDVYADYADGKITLEEACRLMPSWKIGERDVKEKLR